MSLAKCKRQTKWLFDTLTITRWVMELLKATMEMEGKQNTSIPVFTQLHDTRWTHFVLCYLAPGEPLAVFISIFGHCRSFLALLALVLICWDDWVLSCPMADSMNQCFSSSSSPPCVSIVWEPEAGVWKTGGILHDLHSSCWIYFLPMSTFAQTHTHKTLHHNINWTCRSSKRAS